MKLKTFEEHHESKQLTKSIFSLNKLREEIDLRLNQSLKAKKRITSTTCGDFAQLDFSAINVDHQ